MLAALLARKAILRAEPNYAQPEAGASQGLALEAVATGLTEVTDLQFVPGHPSTLVVLQKSGRATWHRLDDDTHGELFTAQVKTASEMGLLGLAFAPDFATSGRFYVDLNPADGGDRTEVSTWTVDPVSLAGAALERVLLEVVQPYPNHDGGQLATDADGLLYIALGDGGYRGDPFGAGQDRSTLLGSILRIDPSGTPYTVPPGNPHVGAAESRPEIFVSGLRNPWRFSFNADGALIIADVGQDAWEEVSLARAGDNLGWSTREGRHCYPPGASCSASGLVDPVWEYDHSTGQSITGGYLYTGSALPALSGRYLFADFVTGRLWAATLPDEPGGDAIVDELMATGKLVSTFGRDPSGELYLGAYGEGTVYRLVPRP